MLPHIVVYTVAVDYCSYTYWWSSIILYEISVSKERGYIILNLYILCLQYYESLTRRQGFPGKTRAAALLWEVVHCYSKRVLPPRVVLPHVPRGRVRSTAVSSTAVWISVHFVRIQAQCSPGGTRTLHAGVWKAPCSLSAAVIRCRPAVCIGSVPCGQRFRRCRPPATETGYRRSRGPKSARGTCLRGGIANGTTRSQHGRPSGHILHGRLGNHV